MTWQDKALAQVDKVSKRSNRKGPDGPWVGVLLRIHPDIREAMHRAAKAQGVSMQTWMRRIIVMGVAKQLGTGYAVWMDRMPTPIEYGGGWAHMDTNGLRGQKRDNLTGLSGMCTHPGCDQIHM